MNFISREACMYTHWCCEIYSWLSLHHLVRLVVLPARRLAETKVQF